MKKIYITFILATLCIVINSQTITLIHNGNILTNQQNIYVDSIDANFGYMKVEISVRNNSDYDITVNVKRNSVYVLENSSNMFCWGVTCYSQSTSESKNAVTIPGKTTNLTFYVEYVPALSSGETVVEFTFFDVTNLLNNSSVVVHFVEKNNTGLNDLMADEQFRIYTSNNKETLKVSSNLNISSNLIIYNLSGQMVGNFFLPKGNTNLNLPLKLKSGIYLYSILKSKKNVLKDKFLVY